MPKLRMRQAVVQALDDAMADDETAIANLGAEVLRHVAPLHPGDTLDGMSEVTKARLSKSRPAAGILTVATTGTNQDDVVVCTFTRSVLLPRRPGSPGMGAQGDGPPS